jgi:hypothetical protein
LQVILPFLPPMRTIVPMRSHGEWITSYTWKVSRCLYQGGNAQIPYVTCHCCLGVSRTV